MRPDNLSLEQYTQLVKCVMSCNWYEIGRFRQSVYNHPDEIMSMNSSRQSSNKIHSYVFLLPLWNWKWL
ncbi:hypothetical protein Scep_019348 [Stephania cephalantha]|uniref:Uncharacterized protein n=1 Tax=Stephania cephalantha TaxID=152367 RepID=A0AAP0IAI5_9MAGN